MRFSRKPARAEDIEFCRTLYCACVLDFCAGHPGWDYDHVRRSFDDYIRLDQMEIITCGGRPVGWLQLQRKEASLHVVYLFLEEAARGKGMGSAILRSAVQEAKSLKLPCTIDVMKDNVKAADLYAGLGFSLLREDAMKYYFIHPAGAA
jgi:GNAT superfamily N-acetyltransferase